MFIKILQKKERNSTGFTLIELLIVIAIISTIASVVFVAIDPLTRFRDARDSNRWSDTVAILSAIKIDQVDNGGSYLASIAAMNSAQVYMIGTDTTNCNAYNANCDTPVSSSANCVDITGLANEGYLANIPISPNGAVTWTTGHTGYTLEKKGNGILTVRSCESENTTEISVAR